MTATAYGALGPVMSEPKKKIRYIIKCQRLFMTDFVRISLFRSTRVDLVSERDGIAFASKFRFKWSANFWRWFLERTNIDLFRTYKVERVEI